MATTDEIKKLRDETGVSVMQCKKALEDAGGDADKALALLKKKGAEIEKAKVILRKVSASIASKKADRTLGAGVAAAYTHAGGQVVAAVVLACETDFVSKNEEFQKLAYDIAMHVAAMNPTFRTRDDVTESAMGAIREVFEKEVQNIPEPAHTRALEGKIDSYLREKTLLEQPFVKDSTITIRGLLDSAVQKFGEKVELVRFERLSVK